MSLLWELTEGISVWGWPLSLIIFGVVWFSAGVGVSMCLLSPKPGALFRRLRDAVIGVFWAGSDGNGDK